MECDGRTAAPVTPHLVRKNQQLILEFDHLGELVMTDYWPIFSCWAMKASAVSATSRHPWSMVSECPRPGISRNSVTAGLFCCNLYAAATTVNGTVWSFSPAMSRSGPRSGFQVLTRSSVQGLRLAAADWKKVVPEPGTAYLS